MSTAYTPAFLSFWTLLIYNALGVAAVLFFTWYRDRALAKAISIILQKTIWKKTGAWIDVEALSISPMTGKILFKNLRYQSCNEAFTCVQGYITFRFWLRKIQQNYESHPERPCRVFAHLDGVEWFVYNKTDAYDIIKQRLDNENSIGKALDEHIDIHVAGESEGENQLTSSIIALNKILPVQVSLGKGAIVVGNHHLPQILTIAFQKGVAVYKIVAAPSPLDIYQVCLQASLMDLKMSILTNVDYALRTAVDHEHIPLSGRWGWHWIRRMLLFRQAAMKRETEDTAPMLNRFDPEYAKVSTVLEGGNLDLQYWSDTPGLKVNEVEATAPTWGLDLNFVKPYITYGPWTDKARAKIQSFFFPYLYRDAVLTTPAAIGEPRIHAALSINISFADVTFRLPVREISKDWVFEHEVVRPFGWLDVQSSSITAHLTIPMICEESFYSSFVSIRISEPQLLTAINYAPLCQAREIEFSLRMINPLTWNAPRTWKLDIEFIGAELYLLSEHLAFLMDCYADWTSGDATPSQKFVPYRYDIQVKAHSLELLLCVNEGNIIGAPNSHKENAYLIFHMDSFAFKFPISPQDYLPKRTDLSFTLQILSIALRLSLPESNTIGCFGKENPFEIGHIRSMDLDCNATFYTLAEQSDIIKIGIKIAEARLMMYGFLAKYLMCAIDNYTGDHTMFITVDEYRQNQSSSSTHRRGKKQQQPAGRANSKQSHLAITLENTTLCLPHEIYRSDEHSDVDIRMVHVRSTISESEMQTNVLCQKLHWSITNPCGIKIPSLTYTDTRVYAQIPPKALISNTSHIVVTPVSILLDVRLLSALQSIITAFLFSYADDDNALHLEKQLQPTYSFQRQISLLSFDSELRHGEFSCFLRASHGIRCLQIYGNMAISVAEHLIEIPSILAQVLWHDAHDSIEIGRMTLDVLSEMVCSSTTELEKINRMKLFHRQSKDHRILMQRTYRDFDQELPMPFHSYENEIQQVKPKWTPTISQPKDPENTFSDVLTYHAMNKLAKASYRHCMSQKAEVPPSGHQIDQSGLSASSFLEAIKFAPGTLIATVKSKELLTIKLTPTLGIMVAQIMDEMSRSTFTTDVSRLLDHIQTAYYRYIQQPVTPERCLLIYLQCPSIYCTTYQACWICNPSTECGHNGIPGVDPTQFVTKCHLQISDLRFRQFIQAGSSTFAAVLPEFFCSSICLAIEDVSQESNLRHKDSSTRLPSKAIVRNTAVKIGTISLTKCLNPTSTQGAKLSIQSIYCDFGLESPQMLARILREYNSAWLLLRCCQTYHNNKLRTQMCLLLVHIIRCIKVSPSLNDPPFMSQPSNIWRLANRGFQDDDGWRLLMYFRNAASQINARSMQEMQEKSSSANDFSDRFLRGLKEELIGSMSGWRSWEMTDIRASILMRIYFDGENLTPYRSVISAFLQEKIAQQVSVQIDKLLLECYTQLETKSQLEFAAVRCDMFSLPYRIDEASLENADMEAALILNLTIRNLDSQLDFSILAFISQIIQASQIYHGASARSNNLRLPALTTGLPQESTNHRLSTEVDKSASILSKSSQRFGGVHLTAFVRMTSMRLNLKGGSLSCSLHHRGASCSLAINSLPQSNLDPTSLLERGPERTSSRYTAQTCISAAEMELRSENLILVNTTVENIQVLMSEQPPSHNAGINEMTFDAQQYLVSLDDVNFTAPSTFVDLSRAVHRWRIQYHEIYVAHMLDYNHALHSLDGDPTYPNDTRERTNKTDLHIAISTIAIELDLLPNFRIRYDIPLYSTHIQRIAGVQTPAYYGSLYAISDQLMLHSSLDQRYKTSVKIPTMVGSISTPTTNKGSNPVLCSEVSLGDISLRVTPDVCAHLGTALSLLLNGMSDSSEIWNAANDQAREPCTSKLSRSQPDTKLCIKLQIVSASLHFILDENIVKISSDNALFTFSNNNSRDSGRTQDDLRHAIDALVPFYLQVGKENQLAHTSGQMRSVFALSKAVRQTQAGLVMSHYGAECKSIYIELTTAAVHAIWESMQKCREKIQEEMAEHTQRLENLRGEVKDLVNLIKLNQRKDHAMTLLEDTTTYSVTLTNAVFFVPLDLDSSSIPDSNVFGICFTALNLTVSKHDGIKSTVKELILGFMPRKTRRDGQLLWSKVGHNRILFPGISAFIQSQQINDRTTTMIDTDIDASDLELRSSVFHEFEQLFNFIHALPSFILWTKNPEAARAETTVKQTNNLRLLIRFQVGILKLLPDSSKTNALSRSDSSATDSSHSVEITLPQFQVCAYMLQAKPDSRSRLWLQFSIAASENSLRPNSMTIFAEFLESMDQTKDENSLVAVERTDLARGLSSIAAEKQMDIHFGLACESIMISLVTLAPHKVECLLLLQESYTLLSAIEQPILNTLQSCYKLCISSTYSTLSAELRHEYSSEPFMRFHLNHLDLIGSSQIDLKDCKLICNVKSTSGDINIRHLESFHVFNCAWSLDNSSMRQRTISVDIDRNPADTSVRDQAQYAFFLRCHEFSSQCNLTHSIGRTVGAASQFTLELSNTYHQETDSSLENYRLSLKTIRIDADGRLQGVVVEADDILLAYTRINSVYLESSLICQLQALHSLMEYNIERLLILDISEFSVQYRFDVRENYLNGDFRVIAKNVRGIIGRRSLPQVIAIIIKLKAFLQEKQDMAHGINKSHLQTKRQLATRSLSSYLINTSTVGKSTAAIWKAKSLRIGLEVHDLQLALFTEQILPDMDCTQIQLDNLDVSLLKRLQQFSYENQQISILKGHIQLRRLSGRKDSKQILAIVSKWTSLEWLKYISACSVTPILKLPTTRIQMFVTHLENDHNYKYSFETAFDGGIDINLNLSFYNQLQQMFTRYIKDLRDELHRYGSPQSFQVVGDGSPAKSPEETTAKLQPVDEVKSDSRSITLIATAPPVLNPQLKVIGGATPKDVLGYLGIKRDLVPNKYYSHVVTPFLQAIDYLVLSTSELTSVTNKSRIAQAS